MRFMMMIAVLTMVTVQGVAFAAPKAKNLTWYTDVDKPYVLTDRDDTVVIKVGFKGAGDRPAAPRLPFNLSIVLDKSGSMQSQDKMENAKRAALELLQYLNADDIVSLVVYDTEARVVVPAQRFKNPEAFAQAVRGIYADGSTALYSGLEYAAREIHKTDSDAYMKRIILLSDGLANVGPSRVDDFDSFGRELLDSGITVSTVGVGMDYNEDVMTVISQRSAGNAYFAKDSDALPQIFTEEIGESMTQVAKNTRVHLECLGNVVPVGSIGRQGRVSGNAVDVDIHTVYGKNEKYALVEVQLPAGGISGISRIARASVTYTDPFTGEVVRETKDVEISGTKDEQLALSRENKKIIEETMLTKNSEVKQKVIALADKGQYQEAAQYEAYYSNALEKAAIKCDNSKALLDAAASSKQLKKELEENKGLSNFQRKSMMNEAYTQSSQQSFVNENKK